MRRRRRRKNPDLSVFVIGGVVVAFAAIAYATKAAASPSAPRPRVKLPTAKRPADLPPVGFPENQGVITVAAGTVVLEPDGSTSSLPDDVTSEQMLGAGFLPGCAWRIAGVPGLYTLLSDGTASHDSGAS